MVQTLNGSSTMTKTHTKGRSSQEQGICIKKQILKLILNQILELIFKDKFQTFCEYSFVAQVILQLHSVCPAAGNAFQQPELRGKNR